MLPSDATEAGFWDAIAEAPEDEVPRLIFADWLEERDDPRAPLFRHRLYWPYLKAEVRDPVQAVLSVLDASRTHPEKPLRQAASMVGASLIPGLLERCRADESFRTFGAAELLAALSPDCLLPILPDLIDLLPRHSDALASVLAQIGPPAVAAVPALLEAERTRALGRQRFGQTIAGIGPTAGNPSVIARLVDILCEDEQPDSRAAVADALAIVAQPCLATVLKTVLERSPAHFSSLAWRLVPEKAPVPHALREALRSTDDCVCWGAACAVARESAEEALPHLLDALRRAPLPLLEPVIRSLHWLRQESPEAVPLLRELLALPELPFAKSVAQALVAHCGDKAGEVVERLRDPDPLVRRRILHGVAHHVTKEERGRLAVVGALHDPDLEVRRAAAMYCSEVIFLSWSDEAALAPLRKALSDSEPQVRAGAANALRHLRGRAAPAEAELLTLLRHDPDARVRRSAAYSLATVEYETQAIFAGLEAGLDDPDEEVRRTCAWGLGNWDSMTADRVRIVIRRLRQVDSFLAEYLTYAVCKSQAALPEVVAFLHDAVRTKGNRSLQGAAAVRLGRLKVDDPAVLSDLFGLFDAGVEKAAVALCWVGPAAVPGLIERLQQGSAEMREHLLRRASDCQSENPHLSDLLPGVLTCLQHQGDGVRRAALRGLRGSNKRSAEGARLVEALIWQERDSTTRYEAVAVLACISPAPEAVAKTFAKVLKDRDKEVRSAVPHALGSLRLSPDLELELLRTALRDHARSVQKAAVWRVKSLGPAAAELLPDLLSILDEPDLDDWGRTCVIRTLEAMGSVAEPALAALRGTDRIGDGRKA